MAQTREEKNAKQRAAYAAMSPEAKAAKHARSVARWKASGRNAYAELSPEKRAARLAQCRAWNAANKERRKGHAKYGSEEHANYIREWRAKNADKERGYRAKAYENGGREYQAAYWERVKESKRAVRREQSRAWRQANPHKVAAKQAERRATLLRATPAWLTPDDRWLINEIYELCALRTRLTGVEHHVDHFYPLKGREGCGLHVPSNLRVIPARANLVKRNKFPCTASVSAG